MNSVVSAASQSHVLHVVEGVFIDPLNDVAFSGSMLVQNGKIQGFPEKSLLKPTQINDLFKFGHNRLIVPPFIDAHGHAESTKVKLSQRDPYSAAHGTFAQVFDWHEIANVLGLKAIDWALAAHSASPLPHAFMVPSCVPAAGPDVSTSGASLPRDQLLPYLSDPRVTGLAEVMNYPGVIDKLTPDLIQLIEDTHYHGKIVDGHCPVPLSLDDARTYYAGHHITSDHEKKDINGAV